MLVKDLPEKEKQEAMKEAKEYGIKSPHLMTVEKLSEKIAEAKKEDKTINELAGLPPSDIQPQKAYS